MADSTNEYLLNIDPSNKEVVALHDQSADPDEVYDLGDAEDLEQNGERVRQLSSKIAQLAEHGDAREIRQAVSAKVKFNGQIMTLDEFLILHQ